MTREEVYFPSLFFGVALKLCDENTVPPNIAFNPHSQGGRISAEATGRGVVRSLKSSSSICVVARAVATIVHSLGRV